jgi:hypothetical protein
VTLPCGSVVSQLLVWCAVVEPEAQMSRMKECLRQSDFNDQFLSSLLILQDFAVHLWLVYLLQQSDFRRYRLVAMWLVRLAGTPVRSAGELRQTRIVRALILQVAETQRVQIAKNMLRTPGA